MNEIVNKKNKFAQIPEKILNNTKISNNAKILYCHLFMVSFFNNKSNSFYISNKELEVKMGCNDKSLSKYINELIDAKYLKREIRTDTKTFKNPSQRRLTIIKY